MFGKLFKRTGSKSRLKVGLAFDGNTVFAAGIAPAEDGSLALTACFADAYQKLGQWVADHQLSNAPAAIVLEHGHYLIQQLERPDVAEDELRNALRWKLKDFLDYPPTEAVLDYYRPPEARQKRGDMLQVVAANRKMLLQRLQAVREAGLDAQRIDIPDFSLRNLISRALRISETTALVFFQEARGQLVICRDDQLYLSRSLDIGLRRLINDDAQLGQLSDTNDRIALEIQRTMDYYESHFGQAPVKRLLIAGEHASLERLAQYASSVLGIAAETVGLEQLCSAGNPGNGHENTPLAVGVALGLE